MKVNSSKKYGVVAIVICLVFVLGVFVGPAINPILGHRDPSLSVNVYATKTEAISGITASIEAGNVITDIGEKYVGDIIGFDNVTSHNATKWISLSNAGSASSSWTVLSSEVNANGFSRALGTVADWTNAGDYAFNVTKTFTATGTQQLQTAGLNWNNTPTSDNNLFACADFTQTTFNSDDTLTITWVITVNAN
jgi:hypothetical protein